MLRVVDLHVYYGDSHVLQGVSLEVHPGEIVCLLGRNGAGKTAAMRGIMGLSRPASGKVFFCDNDITGAAVFENARKGIAFVHQDRRIFPGLTVDENLQVAGLPPGEGSTTWPTERIYQVFPLLAHLRRRRGGNLSGGEQQMLAIARALVGNPRLLLLDEPCEGLAPVIVEDLGKVISDLKRSMPILMAEQNARFALSVADRGYVVEKGMLRYQGAKQNLLNNAEVQSRYLAV